MTSLSQKLQLKAGQGLALINPPANYADFLTTENISIVDKSDAVLIFVNSLAETNQIVPAALASLQPDALAWVAYPKGSSGVKADINRDKLWDALKNTGWRPVRQIALDDVWTVLRFRPVEKVGKIRKMKPATIGTLPVIYWSNHDRTSQTHSLLPDRRP